ncbi:MAG: DUF308 domain-containing protein [Clostridiales bacterium]|nr:DUF308 domain-containing protein [Clostridiales bacterium]
MKNGFDIKKIIASDKKRGGVFGLLIGALPLVFAGIAALIVYLCFKEARHWFILVMGIAFIGGGIYTFFWGVSEYKYFKRIFLNGEILPCQATGITDKYIEDNESGGWFSSILYTVTIDGNVLSKKSPYCFKRKQAKKILENKEFFIVYNKELDEALYYYPKFYDGRDKAL